MGNIASTIATGALVGQSIYAATQKSKLRAQFFNAATGDSLCLFDLQKSESYKHAGKVTRFPVESGAQVSDHIILEPDTIDLECLITDTPFDDNAMAQAVLNTGLGATVGPLGIVTGGAATAVFNAQRGSSSSPSILKYTILRDAWRAGLRLNVQTKLGTYIDMLIESMTVPRDSSISDGLMFSISLVTVLVAESQTVSSKDLASPPLASGKADVGDQSVDKVNKAALESGEKLGDKSAFGALTSAQNKLSSLADKAKSLIP